MKAKTLALLLMAGSLLAFRVALAATMPVQTAGDIRYVSGGIGSDEVAAIKEQAGEFSLVLEFAERAGKRERYIADVNVDISGARGAPVLNVRTDGPFLLVDLPAGSYKVSATYKGITQSRIIQVGNGTAHAGWSWEAVGAEDEPVRAPDE